MTGGAELSYETALPHRAAFQPVVDLATGRAIGWEAEPHHWKDEEDGGLGVLASVLAAGAPPEDGLVFVQLSADVIGDRRLIEQVEQLPARIVVDIRGSEIDRLESKSDELDSLATAGVHLSLEGASGASLAMIARVRPTFLRIDAVLVRDIVHDPTSRSVVAAYAAFAELEGIHVIAEGVETHEQADSLRSLGVGLARGPLFGRPSIDWTAPTTRRRRPPLALDPLREFRDALGELGDVDAVAEHLVGALLRIGSRAVVYLERDGLFRAAAHRGHAALHDGIPVRDGILGDAFRTGTLVHEIDQVTGSVRVAHDLRGDQRVLGVVALAMDGMPTAAEEASIRGLAEAAGDRLAEVGTVRGQSMLNRLARAMLEMSLFDQVDQVETGAPRLATAVSGMSSALFALPGTTGLDVKSRVGPLSPDLHRLSPETLARLLDKVGAASSCVTLGDGTDLPEELRPLHEAGASTLVAMPVRSTECGVGLLLLGDHARRDLTVESREALELVAGAVGRTLDMVVVVDDLRVRATVDTLTGLGNLAAFQEALTTMGARRRGGWALVMADVDGLKNVNDTHGHLAGDFALRSLAGALLDVLRNDDRMFRIGGDEFAALLQDVDADGAAEIGRRMCEAAAHVMAEFDAGLSVGIAIPEQGESPADFIDRADKMLYEVKREARGTVRVASSPSSDKSAASRPEISVLVICTGNLCRSPMAQAILRAKLEEKGVHVDIGSAGLATEGRSSPPEVRDVLAARGLAVDAHRSRRLQAADLQRPDLVLAMERRHVREVAVLDRDAFERTFTLPDLARRMQTHGPRRSGEDVASYLHRVSAGREPADALGTGDDEVADPYGQDAVAYRRAANEIDGLLEVIVAHLFP